MDLKVFSYFLLFSTFCTINAGFHSKCEIEGVDILDWFEYYTINKTIDDTYEGLVVSFKTRFILAMRNYSSYYLNATFFNQTLSIYTNEKFKLFEKDYQGSSVILIRFSFKCEENGSDTLEMRQKINDFNDYPPMLNNKIYNYNFGMALPEDYEISNFIPISAFDKDFSNNNIYFTIEYNENFKIWYKGISKQYKGKDYYTTLQTLREISPPFKQELLLVATDDGNPSKNATARVIVTVSSRQTKDGTLNFSKLMFEEEIYFANYTNDELIMDKIIFMRYGEGNDTKIKQSAFQDYFKIVLDSNIKGALKVIKLKSLPKKITDNETKIVIQIEAERKQIHEINSISNGHVTLIIRILKSLKENLNEGWNHCVVNVSDLKNCVFVAFFMFFSALALILLMNIVVYLCHFEKTGRKCVAEDVGAQIDEKESKQKEVLKI